MKSTVVEEEGASTLPTHGRTVPEIAEQEPESQEGATEVTMGREATFLLSAHQWVTEDSMLFQALALEAGVHLTDRTCMSATQ
jgi:hypothetical protein